MAHIQAVRADRAVSVSELKKNPSAIMSDEDGSPIAVLNHNKVMGYFVPAQQYEQLLDYVEDLRLELTAIERIEGQVDMIEMSWEELEHIANG
ncbi:type II toxin-antitoxin system Phd/YefM family antitoxin [Ochrobactrum sp. BTU1]|uniref:type II toxin-antitoxin system Phd/YefM family antitoxin n=1 Tax=Ochrobactrum sp. BTU1 TaxID=2840456 RepID=UPI001C04499D|nr:type II toxin-antitoxin system Phd/YefM family antitoxin [Ochrobactrum sp. BTU1]